MTPFLPLSLASVELYPEFIRKVEDLTGMDVGYRNRGALDVITDGSVKKEISAAIALQHRAGLRSEVLSAERVRRMEPH
jgi:glycine oxidase